MKSAPSFSKKPPGAEVTEAAVEVFTRVRPPIMARDADPTNTKCVEVLDNYTMRLTLPDRKHSQQHDYNFNHCFSMDATQEDVYRVSALPLVGHIFEGFNTCLMAYGQTGSGKTHTMMGSGGSEDTIGIIPRLLHDIFVRVSALSTNTPRDGDKATKQAPMSIKVEISYFEIYCEEVVDLITPSTSKGIKLRDTPRCVEGVSVHPCDGVATVLRLIEVGNANRTTASTKMNDRSSRSHAVLQLVVTSMTLKALGAGQRISTKESITNLVDLAGSESQKRSAVDGVQLEEMKKINLSLLTLGRVINALSSTVKPKPLPPYRESVLTRVLQASFGGNSRTFMLAMVSPALADINESDNTLNYAKIARRITTNVHTNEDSSALLLRDLASEVKRLKDQLKFQQEAQRDAATGTSTPRFDVPPQLTGVTCGTDGTPWFDEGTQEKLDEAERTLTLVQDQVVNFVQHNSLLQSALTESEERNGALRQKAVELERAFAKKMDAVVSRTPEYLGFMQEALVGPGDSELKQLRAEVFLSRKYDAVHKETSKTLSESLEVKHVEVNRLSDKCREATTVVCDMQNRLMRTGELEMKCVNLGRLLDSSQERETKYLEDIIELKMRNLELEKKAAQFDAITQRMRSNTPITPRTNETMAFFGFTDPVAFEAWQKEFEALPAEEI